MLHLILIGYAFAYTNLKLYICTNKFLKYKNMSKKNVAMNEKFFSLNESEKMDVLNVDSSIFNTPRFKGIEKDVVLFDLWSGKTNAEKRNLLK